MMHRYLQSDIELLWKYGSDAAIRRQIVVLWMICQKDCIVVAISRRH